jgi:hypothetical protein
MNNFNRQIFYKEKNYIPENEDIILKDFFEKTSKKIIKIHLTKKMIILMTKTLNTKK